MSKLHRKPTIRVCIEELEDDFDNPLSAMLDKIAHDMKQKIDNPL